MRWRRSRFSLKGTVGLRRSERGPPPTPPGPIRATRCLGVTFRTGQAINPLHRGHVAFRTDDIAAVRKRLEEKGIPYSDYGAWAMGGWHQIFFYDPDGNVVEVHQVVG